MTKIVTKCKTFMKKAEARYDAHCERVALDNSGAGDEAMNVIIGILVSLVLIGIVMRIISPQVEGWTNQMTNKFSDILGGNFNS